MVSIRMRPQDWVDWRMLVIAAALGLVVQLFWTSGSRGTLRHQCLAGVSGSFERGYHGGEAVLASFGATSRFGNAWAPMSRRGTQESNLVWRVGRVGGMPLRGLSVGDLDGDGLNEIAVGDFSGKVRIYQFDGQTFVDRAFDERTGTDYFSFAGRAYGMDIGDLDGDSKNELCVGDFNSRLIRVIAWTGSRYEVIDSIQVGYRALGLAIGDVNGDGREKLVCGTGGGDPSVEGNGVVRVLSWEPEAGFSEIWSEDLGEEVYEIEIGDLDGDSRNEILAGTRDSFFMIKFDSTTFEKTWQLANVGFYAYDICIGDLDNDGGNELLLGSSWKQPRLFEIQSGQMVQLGPLPTEQSGLYGTTSTTADIDGNGRNELYVIDVTRYGSHLRQFSWDSGSWRQNWAAALNPDSDTLDMGNVDAIDWFSGLRAADVTGDGKPELIAADFFGYVHIYSWTGSQMSEIWRQSVGESSMGLAVADFDNDAEMEVIAGGNNGIVTALDRVDGAWREVWRDHVGRLAMGSAYAIHAVDMQNDGTLELSVCGFKYDVHLYRYDAGEGAFRELWSTNLTGRAGWAYGRRTDNMAAGDVDGDNLPEILVGDVQGVVHLVGWQNNAYVIESSLRTDVRYSWGGNSAAYAIALLGLENETVPQVLVGCSIGLIKTYRWHGGSFEPLGVVDVEYRPDGPGAGLDAIVVGDVDNDGGEEVVVGTVDSLIVFSASSGQLRRKWSTALPRPYGLLVADLNADSLNELVVGGQDGVIRFMVWTANGLTTFEEVDIGEDAWCIRALDWDADGYQELLAGNRGGDILVIETEKLSFLKPNRAPGAAALLSPPPGSVIGRKSPALAFLAPLDPDSDIVYFVVDLALDSLFSTGLVSYNSNVYTDRFHPAFGSGSRVDTIRFELPAGLTDGRWYWRVRAWDGKVWGPCSEEWSFVVDTTPPRLDSLQFVDAVYGGRWYNPHTDTVAMVRVWYDETYPKRLGVSSSFLPDTVWVGGFSGGSGRSVTVDLSFSGVPDGQYPTYWVMEDSAGNRGGRVDTLCVDGRAPWGYWSDTPDTVSGGSSRVVHVLGATDGEGSGVGAVYLGVFSSPDSVPTVRRDNVRLPTVPGRYYVRYFAEDHVGNRGEIRTDTVVVRAAPVLVVQVSDGVERAELSSELEVVIRVGNEGNEAARGVVIVDTLPEWVDLVGVKQRDYRWLGDRVLSWGIGDLGADQVEMDTVVVRVRDGDHVPGDEVRLRHGVRVEASGGYGSWSWDETWVRGVDLELGLELSPSGEVNVGSEVQVHCWWTKALRWGLLGVEPEGLEWRFAPGEGCRDTVWVFRVLEEGEHEVIFSGEDLVGERGEVRVGFRVTVREFFEVDRNRLQLGLGDVVGVRYGLLRSSGVRLAVYNVAGELVRVLVDGVEPQGERRLEWDGRDEEGRLVSPGLYLLYFESGGKRQIAKILVVR